MGVLHLSIAGIVGHFAMSDRPGSLLHLVSAIGIGFQTTEECSEVKLGYTFDSTVVDALCVWLVLSFLHQLNALYSQANDIANTLSRASTFALVLHPIGQHSIHTSHHSLPCC